MKQFLLLISLINISYSQSIQIDSTDPRFVEFFNYENFTIPDFQEGDDLTLKIEKLVQDEYGNNSGTNEFINLHLYQYDLEKTDIKVDTEVVSNTCNDETQIKCELIYPMNSRVYFFAEETKNSETLKFPILASVDNYDEENYPIFSYDVEAIIQNFTFLSGNKWFSEKYYYPSSMKLENPRLKCDSYDWIISSSESKIEADFLIPGFITVNPDLGEVVVGGITESLENVGFEKIEDYLELTIANNNVGLGSLSNNFDIKLKRPSSLPKEKLFNSQYCTVSLRGNSSSFINKLIPYIDEPGGLVDEARELGRKSEFSKFKKVKYSQGDINLKVYRKTVESFQQSSGLVL